MGMRARLKGHSRRRPVGTTKLAKLVVASCAMLCGVVLYCEVTQMKFLFNGESLLLHQLPHAHCVAHGACDYEHMASVRFAEDFNERTKINPPVFFPTRNRRWIWSRLGIGNLGWPARWAFYNDEYYNNDPELPCGSLYFQVRSIAATTASVQPLTVLLPPRPLRLTPGRYRPARLCAEPAGVPVSDLHRHHHLRPLSVPAHLPISRRGEPAVHARPLPFGRGRAGGVGHRDAGDAGPGDRAL